MYENCYGNVVSQLAGGFSGLLQHCAACSFSCLARDYSANSAVRLKGVTGVEVLCLNDLVMISLGQSSFHFDFRFLVMYEDVRHSSDRAGECRLCNVYILRHLHLQGCFVLNHFVVDLKHLCHNSIFLSNSPAPNSQNTSCYGTA